MQILVVDDSPLMRKYVTRTLEMTGLDVEIHQAANGREAMDCAGRIHPDLIITDLNMPEMGGEELIAHVTADPRLSGTPILVLSADHSDLRCEELLDSGAAAYLTKPVTPESLRGRLLHIIGGEH